MMSEEEAKNMAALAAARAEADRAATRRERVRAIPLSKSFRPQDISRPVQRAWRQDDTMDFYDEADALPPGGIRLAPSEAPMTSDETLVPLKALEEAPDGLRRLDWSGHGMQKLPKIPSHFKNSRVVLLHDNKLPEFPQELANMRLMQTLRIDSNSITSVPSYINTFTLLQHIRAHDNSIQSLSSNIGSCKQLVSLDLQRNQLESLPPSIGACISLTKLWISHNRLGVLPFTLSHLRALRSLRVDKNHLDELGFNLKPLTNLTQLRIGHNNIKHLPEDIGTTKRLEELAVNHNKLVALPPSICKLKLKLLAIDENPLKRPPAEVSIRGLQAVFKYLNRLMYSVETWDLDLANFNLSSIPFPTPETAAAWETKAWIRLKVLSLPNNKLFSLPLDLHLMSNLTILDIANNCLSTVPPSVGSLTALQVLDASGNNVQALPRQMSKNIQLAELLLENNRCTSIPPVVMELQALTELRLTSNRLLKVIDGLGNALKLQVLHLQHNQIKTMPSGMSRLWRLKILKMSHNALFEVPASFVKIRPLDDPPKHISEDNAQGTKQALGTLIDPRVRRKRVRDVLFGGERKPYRSIPRRPLIEREWDKPPGAGDRKGWDLVRFALFGEDGPHLKRPGKIPVLPQETEKGSEDESEVDEEEGETPEAQPVRAGFVQRLRAVFQPQKKLEKPGKHHRKGDKEEGDEGEPSKKDEKAEEAEEKPADEASGTLGKAKEGKGKDAAPEEPGGFFGQAKASFKKFTQRFEKQKKQKEDGPGDDYGAYCRELIELDLSYNIIERLPPDFGNISTLTKLNLGHNRLERMPRSLNCFENLKELNLADNIFSDVPPEVAKLKVLEKLDFSRQGKGDLLQTLPMELIGLEFLKELRLSGNNFSYLPDCIFPEMDGTIVKQAGMTNLRVLAIDDNPLLGLDENLAICGKLEKLYVHNTKIRRLNKSITYMYQLQEIWIANTSIRKLDSAIATLPYLRKLGTLTHNPEFHIHGVPRGHLRRALAALLLNSPINPF